LTDPNYSFAVCEVPFQSVRSSNELTWEPPGRGKRGDRKTPRNQQQPKIELGDRMSRLAIAICALFLLVFTGGLNPEPQHEGLLLLSLTLLIYMAAFSATKKKQKS
jgi:hypothetical protein